MNQDKILQSLREYMTYKNVPIDTQQHILTTANYIYKQSYDDIHECISEILLDEKVTFSDIPQIIRLLSSSVLLVTSIKNVKLDYKLLLRYFIFYIILNHAGRELIYMPSEDLYAFYDSIFDLLISKIVKTNCICQ